jgi:hypothetical protein
MFLIRENSCGAKKDNSPLNLNILKKIAMPLLKRTDFGRMGIRKKMFKAALNPNRFLEPVNFSPELRNFV